MRGSVSLHSADPFDPPELNINQWAYQQDLNTMIYAIRTMRKLLSTPPLSTVVGAELVPGPAYQTDAQLTEWIIANGVLAGHWSGSARLGNTTDPLGVVDPRLRVKGVTGLRVADASVIPIIGQHTHSATVMVAERAAVFIEEDNADK